MSLNKELADNKRILHCEFTNDDGGEGFISVFLGDDERYYTISDFGDTLTSDKDYVIACFIDTVRYLHDEGKFK